MATIVVKLAPGEKTPEIGDELAGGKVKVSFPGEPWVVVERGDYDYAAFEDDPRIMQHREEQEVHPMVMPDTPRMLDAVSVGDTFPMCGINDDVLRMGHYGEGVVVAVVDTGVYSSHEAFSGKNFLGDNIDQVGHGTHVSSTAASAWGIASDATILSKRVLDGPNGSGTESSVALGLQAVADWTVANKADVVINLSLGGGASGVIDSGVSYCQQRGIWVAAAAGNDGPNAVLGSPARAADFVVGCVDRNSAIASFSSGDGTWQQITCFMPGVGIAAAKAGTQRDIAVFSGTSMATPHLVGCLALLRRGGLTLTQARSYIYANMTDIGAQNRKGLFVVKANFAQDNPPPPDPTPPWKKDDAVGITQEVEAIVTRAQASNWNATEKSRMGSIKDYMQQLRALLPETTDPWESDAFGITEEVEAIVTEAQASNWSAEEKSRMGSIKDYMQQLRALFPDGGPPPPPPLLLLLLLLLLLHPHLYCVFSSLAKPQLEVQVGTRCECRCQILNRQDYGLF